MALAAEAFGNKMCFLEDISAEVAFFVCLLGFFCFVIAIRILNKILVKNISEITVVPGRKQS